MTYSEYKDAYQSANITVGNDEITGLYEYLSDIFDYDNDILSDCVASKSISAHQPDDMR